MTALRPPKLPLIPFVKLGFPGAMPLRSELPSL